MGRKFLLMVFVVSGCYARTFNDLPRWAKESPAASNSSFDHALYQSTRAALLPGNAIEHVNNGKVFQAMVEEIGRAEHNVHILSYIWQTGEPSESLLVALRERKKAVKCRVIVDPVGSVGFEKEIKPRLEQMGCEVFLYRERSKVSPRRAMARTHRKLVITDGKVGITGGFAIKSDWLGNGRAEKETRDSNVRVRGPVVRDMQQSFAQSWLEAGGALLDDAAFPALKPVGPARAAFVSSMDTVGMSDAERMTLLLIATAQRRIWIANAYFVPSDAVRDALIRRAKTGVDVRIICPGPVHDHASVRAAQRNHYDALTQAGARIWEYQPSLMHAKTILVDDSLAVVGSTNLDALSLNTLDEGSLVIDDSGAVAALEQEWREDLGFAREVGRDGSPPTAANSAK